MAFEDAQGRLRGGDMLMKVTGDIQRLSFRDMNRLAGTLVQELGNKPLNSLNVAEAILKATDTIQASSPGRQGPVYRQGK